MPAYAGNGQAVLLFDNRQAYLWQNEVVPAGVYPGSLSVAFQLERRGGSFYPWGASVEVYFSTNPGAFEIDIVGASTDQAQNYSQIGSITVASSYVAGHYVGRWDMPSNVWVKYMAAYMKTLTNAVNTTLLVTR
jgi:hypothetical protein